MRRLLPLLALLMCFAVAPLAAQPSLGETTFPNSGSAEAQEPFKRGLLLLHSFEYDDAREAFQEARAIDPNFLMAYWGEAMTYNHPIWHEQDRDAALAVLRAIPDEARANASERELAYLTTLDPLFGDGAQAQVYGGYATASAELAQMYPEDLDAATFHALAILGTAYEGRDLEVYDRAGQIALAAFAQNPLHPGAAHYVIHAYDDPLNAAKALDAARAYSGIAPDAPHALHMPSHIYFALGMWDEGAEINVRAFEAARARDEANGVALGGHGWHPLYWLHYAELQRGRFEEARRILDMALNLAESGPTDRAWSSVTAMRANHVVETEDWTGETAMLELPIEELDGAMAQRDAFIRGLVALRTGDRAGAEDALIEVRAYLERGEEPGLDEQATALMLEGLVLLDSGDDDAGLARLHEATAIEDQMPADFGPPSPVKPAHELLGEALLKHERFGEAKEEFEKALERIPGRRSSLVGLLQAGSQVRDVRAVRRALQELCGIQFPFNNLMYLEMSFLENIPSPLCGSPD